MNFCIMTGRLVRDPEIRNTANDKIIAKFTIAVDRDYKDKDGNRPADFLNCTAWGNSAVFLDKYASKGVKVCVYGSVQSSSWEGQDGKTKYATGICCARVEIIGPLRRKKETGINYDTVGSRPKRQQNRNKSIDDPGSGYQVYSPPGFDDLDYGDQIPY